MQHADTIRRLGKSGSGRGEDQMKITIINKTSAAIGKVTEVQISPTERALIIEEAAVKCASVAAGHLSA